MIPAPEALGGSAPKLLIGPLCINNRACARREYSGSHWTGDSMSARQDIVVNPSPPSQPAIPPFGQRLRRVAS